MQFRGKLLISAGIAIGAALITTYLQQGALYDPVILGGFLVANLACTLLLHRAGTVPRPAPGRRAPGNRAPGNRAPGKRAPNSSKSTGREQGTVKWFNRNKGFGFITRDNGEEIFVHFRAIRGEGRRSLSDGQRVAFHTASSKKGPQAEDVEILDRTG